jgi:hypothetical protein
VGYEFNLGGTVGWNAFNAAGNFVNVAAGRTVAAGDSNASGGNDFIEWQVSRTAAQPNGLMFNPIGDTKFNLAFVAEDTTGDYYPNAADVDWFVYDTAGTYNFGPPGDGNGDGAVDINDYLAIRANSFTRVFLGKSGDVDDNGFVDFADFHAWKTAFPGGPAAAEAAIAGLGTPEPGSVAITATGLSVFALLRRRRR